MDDSLSFNMFSQSWSLVNLQMTSSQHVTRIVTMHISFHNATHKGSPLYRGAIRDREQVHSKHLRMRGHDEADDEATEADEEADTEVFWALSKGSCYLRGVFLNIFSGFAIDRWKKYIKTIKIYMKTDAVDPQAAADNPPTHTLVTMVKCMEPYNPQYPVK